MPPVGSLITRNARWGSESPVAVSATIAQGMRGVINYYQLLGLDPDVIDPDRDKVAIRKRIEEMRGEWSSGSAADPRQASANRARLDSELIPDLEGTDVQKPRPEVWRQHRQLERQRLNEEEVRAEARIGQLAELLRK